MSSSIRKVFEDKKKQDKSVFITFLTAGFPLASCTVDIMLALEAGGTDIIELGIPFSDPMVDGPAIQYSNSIALKQNVNMDTCFSYVKEARERGLKAPVIFMGYYNPILQYGEERTVKNAKEAGGNGFIVVDLPPEEGVEFREFCSQEEMSWVPLIAPSTSNTRIEFLSSIADSFVYVVSKMGTTGVSSQVNSELPAQLSRIKSCLSKPIPLAVGFGVSTPEQFRYVGSMTDGVVIGSKLISVLCDEKDQGNYPSSAKKFCANITKSDNQDYPKTNGNVNGVIKRSTWHHKSKSEIFSPTFRDFDRQNIRTISEENEARSTILHPSAKVKVTTNHLSPKSSSFNGQYIPRSPTWNSQSKIGKVAHVLPPKFGGFGGQYVPEALCECLCQLEVAHRRAISDPTFREELESYFNYINRPSRLYEAKRLSEFSGGARIWFKREDLNHTGSHKINNAIGQILLARRLGKTRIIAETGSGQHGVATATACAQFGLECCVYMGAEDVERQPLNVFKMKMLGAKVVSVTSGNKTLKDAMNETLRDLVANMLNTYYIIGSVVGPHPFPTIVRDFQCIIGKEIKWQVNDAIGKLPDAVVACVGGGSNAIGAFYPFIHERNVRLIGVEAGGDGIDTPRHSATLTKGSVGVFHGVKTYFLQDSEGNISPTHSVSAGLDYPGVGPELSYLKENGRAEYVVASNEEALKGFRYCTQYEGIIPALEASHAVWATIELAKSMPKESNIVMCLSGRGDKDVEQISKILPSFAEKIDWHIEN